ncbi:MAG: alpha/beta hydrolase [Rhodomicrobium sp.]
MITKKLPLLRFPAILALSILTCACKNDVTSLEFVQESPQPAANAAGAVPETDQLNRVAKQSFRKPSPSSEGVASEGGFIQVKMVKKGPAIKSEPAVAPLRHTKTKLIEFQNAPFPYNGIVPSSGRHFLDVNEDGRRGHRTSNGAVYWEDQTYSDRRTLLHIPKGFDLRRPALMVIFLHGHGATLQRDVIDRQRVPEQVSEAGVNAVLVAPQLASDAADSSAGKLWEPGAFQRFLQEATAELVKIHGDPRSKPVFDNMPIVIVAYSGGYATAASCIRHGGAGERVRGVVLLDALYGDIETFASWISSRQKAFFLSAFANSTRAHNAELEEMLKDREVAYNTKLQGSLRGGSVTFVSTAPDTEHRDFVTHAWAHHPVKDLLQRLRAEAR